MRHELTLRPEAQAELAEASEWYEARVPGLGLEFIRSVDSSSIPSLVILNPIP